MSIYPDKLLKELRKLVESVKSFLGIKAILVAAMCIICILTIGYSYASRPPFLFVVLAAIIFLFIIVSTLIASAKIDRKIELQRI